MTERHGHDHSSSSDHDKKIDDIFDLNLIQPILKYYSIKDNKLHDNIYNEKYLIRPLSISDYDHGFIDLLRQLTECGQITYDEFKQRFYQMKQCLNTYYILIIEDINLNKQIIGTATLVCEKKFIRQLGIRGRIEDVVVDYRYRGQQLGKLLIDLLTKFAHEKCHCYKISLECKDDLVSFYKQFGYDHEDKQNYLCQRFPKLSKKNE
jgi:glucosamine-phosphate N-acetyltransferase